MPTRSCRPDLSCVTLLAAAVLAPSCNLLVDLPPAPVPLARREVEPLSRWELLRFTIENLGEVEPGLLYRSAWPTPSLIGFLARRVNLKIILDFSRRYTPEELEHARSLGIEVVRSPMSASRPPTPRQVLELIRLTLKARDAGGALLVHCRAGADRTGTMVAIWRQLFTGCRDVDALKHETRLHRHVPLVLPNVHRAIELFRPELYRDFIADPALLDDEDRIRELESRHHENYPLLSGRSGVYTGPLLAGAAKADLLAGWDREVQMATYGPFPRKATGVREHVFARAIVLDNGSVRLALVSCDLLISDLELRAAVFREVEARGVALDDLLLAATHTHTSVGAYVDHWAFELYMLGPFDPEFRRHLAERIAAAVVEAAGSLVPARLGTGTTHVEGVSHNRRLGTTVDRGLGLLKLTKAGGAPLAVVVNFAAHPILEPADGKISSDYPGLLAKKLDESHGFGLFLGGALGDINANAPGREDDWTEPGLAAQVAARLHEAVEKTADSIATETEVELGSLTALVDLPPFNLNLIPDLFFPLEWLAKAAVRWPERAPLQAMQLGPAVLVATSSEIDVDLGSEIKRGSFESSSFVVTHANGYTGYALEATLHALRKLDASSLVAHNGSRHGRYVVDAALPLVAALSRDVEARPTLPQQGTVDLSEPPSPAPAASRQPPVTPQSRAVGLAQPDSLADRVRVEVAGLYREKLHGGDRLVGRRRDLVASLRVRGPWELLLDVRGGYVRSEWEAPGGSRSDEGGTDLTLGLGRAFTLAAEEREGLALRAIPRLELSLPTGNPEPSAPFAFAAGTGVWRPGAGGALELTWETYKRLSLETVYVTSIDDHRGRRPGDRWASALRYSERHGLVSLHVDLTAALQLEDDRRGGRLSADVREPSFELGVRPGLAIHISEPLELFAQAVVPLARAGDGAGEGRGVIVGALLGF